MQKEIEESILKYLIWCDDNGNKINIHTLFDVPKATHDETVKALKDLTNKNYIAEKYVLIDSKHTVIPSNEEKTIVTPSGREYYETLSR